MKNCSREEIQVFLNRNGIIPTAQRVDIAHLLADRCTHLCADDIYKFVNEDNTRDGRRRASKATVYNTLGLFAKEGIVREVIADPSRVFYDPNTSPHHHLYNVTTGELTDIDAANLEISGIPPLPEGTKLDGVDVVVRTRQIS
ncbi:MAG: transcriptional repressor [Gammaproteobacteria bacterium]|nr:transcriptional repressor [Gammaproteobacteria bacterium]